MRRVMLFALLALGLPTVALASGISYDTGKFESGTFSGTFTTSIDATEVGSLDTITIDTGTLTKLSDCSKGFTCYGFSGGSVTVTHDGTTLFTDSLKGGTVKKAGASADIMATLLSNAKVAGGNAVAFFEWRVGHRHGASEQDHTAHDGHDRHDRHGRVEEHRVNRGNIDVSLDPSPLTTPEPSTLGLLGTGLIGLAGLAKRKLKLRS